MLVVSHLRHFCSFDLFCFALHFCSELYGSLRMLAFEKSSWIIRIYSLSFLDDCMDNPCAMNATCTDLVNDFRCECPPGFTGKRCHEKINLCAHNPCVNGLCVDMLHTQRCICEPGWTGELCDVKIDQCASHPCFNGATCKDKVYFNVHSK